MKRRAITAVKVEKAKRIRKRMHRRSSPRVTDPKDLRGAKGALLKSATASASEEERVTGRRRGVIRSGPAGGAIRL